MPRSRKPTARKHGLGGANAGKHGWCGLEVDVLAALAEFMSLAGQGLFLQAQELYDSSLQYHQDEFPIFVGYSTCALDQGDRGRLAYFIYQWKCVAQLNDMILANDEKDLIGMIVNVIHLSGQTNDYDYDAWTKARDLWSTLLMLEKSRYEFSPRSLTPHCSD
jgi:hypothetical protein